MTSRKEIIFKLLYYSIVAYIVISLLTYSPYDPSFTYFSSDQASINNFAGPVGAYVASIVFTYLGWQGIYFPYFIIFLYFWEV